MILEHESTSAHRYVLLRARTCISSTEVSMITAQQPRLTKSFKAFKQLSENGLCIASYVKLRKRSHRTIIFTFQLDLKVKRLLLTNLLFLKSNYTSTFYCT